VTKPRTLGATVVLSAFKYASSVVTLDIGELM